MLSIPQFQAFGISDIGLRRSSNEDAYYIDHSCGCFIVVDGVGGASAGEVASSAFISIASTIVKSHHITSEQEAVSAVKEVFFRANASIIDCTSKNPDHQGMACTAEVLLLHNQGFILGHVGDSRTYRFRNGALVRLTVDHSFVQQQIDLGNLTEQEARSHRYRNVILRAVGTEERIDVDIVRGRVKKDDIFLLCSDGLTDMLGEQEIAEKLAVYTPLKDKVSSLVAQAIQAGGRDNITVILAAIE